MHTCMYNRAMKTAQAVTNYVATTLGYNIPGNSVPFENKGRLRDDVMKSIRII